MNQAFWLLGTHLNVLADEETTGGRYDLIEGRFLPNVATPLHRHTAYSEHLYVLEGEFTVRTEATTVVVKPGENFLIPQGIVHSVACGSAPGRGIVVASPSGCARLIKTAGTVAAPNSLPPTAPPDMEVLARASAEAGDEIVGPPPTGAALAAA